MTGLLLGLGVLSVAAGAPGPVLGPGQEKVLRAVAGGPGEPIVPGWEVAGFRVEEERVAFLLRGPAGTARAVLHGAAPGAPTIETRQGFLELPPGVPPEVGRVLADRLDAVPIRLDWVFREPIEPVPEIDAYPLHPEVAARAREALPATPPGDGSPAPEAAAAPAPRSPWPWALGFGALLLLILAALRREITGIAAIAAGIAAWSLAVPEPAPAPVRPPLPPSLVHPLAGGPCEASPSEVGEHGLSIEVRCERGPRLGAWTLLVTPDRGAEAVIRTPFHAIGVPEGDARRPEVLASARHVEAALREAEGAGFRLEAHLPAPAVPETASGPWWPDLGARPDAERAELRAGAALVAAGIAAALALLFTLLLEARRWPRPIAAVFLLAALLHALAPDRMTMVFGGYDLTAHLAGGLVPRYGPGSVWLYGPPLWLAGPDHAWIQLANRVLGLLVLVAAWDLGRTLQPRRPRADLVSAGLLALSPLLLRAHTSESIAVAPTLLFLLGLRALVDPERPRVVPGLLLLLAAATARPEFAVMAALVLPAWLVLRGPAPIPRTEIAIAAAAAVAVLGARAFTAARAAEALAGTGALPALDDPLSGALGALFDGGALANVDFTPPLFVPLLLLGAAAAPRRAAAFATLAFAAVWIALTGVDLAEVSVPRLHEPAVALVLPVAALGIDRLLGWARDPRTRIRRLGLAASAAVAVAFAGGIVWSAGALFSPRNVDHEERLWRDAVAALPESPGCLAALGYGDPPEAGKTPRHNPTYLLRAGAPGWSAYDLRHVPALLDACPGPVRVLLGIRCYATLRPSWSESGPEGTPLLPACAAVRDRPETRPVFERDVPNHGDTGYPLYPQGSPLRIGLYEITAP